MYVVDYSDFQDLLAQVPHNPANQPLCDAIEKLMLESGVEQYPWTYNIVLTAATVPAAPAPAAQANGAIQIDAAAPFVIISTTMKADVAAAAQTVNTEVLPNATILLTDQSTGRQFMDVALPIPSLFGSARQPYFWPKPKIMPANSTLQWQITNFEAANTNNLRLSFHGYKLLNIAARQQ